MLKVKPLVLLPLKLTTTGLPELTAPFDITLVDWPARVSIELPFAHWRGPLGFNS